VSEDLVRLAVLGDPLAFSLSPELHLAGLEALGLRGRSEALRTRAEDLGARLGELAQGGYRGVNLTAPLKERALAHLSRVSEAARRARSVNTVGFEGDGWWGDTTDGTGFVELLSSFGRRPARERVVLLGAGGSSRSLALALGGAGSRDIRVSAREPERAAEAWSRIPGIEWTRWGSPEERRALLGASLVVNCTPLGGPEGPAALERIGPRALLVDLRYDVQPTAWVRAARAAGREAYDGLGLLVFQARASLSLWTGLAVPLDPLARAVGWPR